MNGLEPGSARILLVEDDEANRYVVARHLRRAGYEVMEVGTGAQALEYARKGLDLIIMDIQLPDIRGTEVSRALRNDAATKSIPILQMSANFTLTVDKVKGLDSGADAYLASPIDPDEMLAHVRMLLRLNAAQTALARSHEELRVHVQALESTKEELALAKDELSRQNELLEQRVQERTRMLEETVQDLETFSYSITHDMRAPLRAMQGYARILLETQSKVLDGQGVDFLNRIASASNRLDLLIRDVLTYSSVARMRPPLGSVDIGRLLRHLLEDKQAFQLPEAEISIREPLPRVLANESFLSQSLTCLLDNAVKFVAPGSTPRIEVYAEQFDSRVRLNVRDQGIGIPLEYQGRLFNLFERAQNEFPGTGVGLAVVRKAVERMGGTVGVSSRSGQGSTFWLELQEARK